MNPKELNNWGRFKYFWGAGGEEEDGGGVCISDQGPAWNREKERASERASEPEASKDDRDEIVMPGMERYGSAKGERFVIRWVWIEMVLEWHGEGMGWRGHVETGACSPDGLPLTVLPRTPIVVAEERLQRGGGEAGNGAARLAHSASAGRGRCCRRRPAQHRRVAGKRG